MIRIASLTPLALLGIGTSGRGQEEPCDFMPPECGGIPVDSEKFQRVASNLWNKFVEGADGKAIDPEAVQKAIDMTGPYLICNFDKFPDSGDHPDTSACYRRCGELAAEKAGCWPWSKISGDDFEEAWCETKEEFKKKRATAANLPGGGATGDFGGPGCM
jgi:hypothetical protein